MSLSLLPSLVGIFVLLSLISPMRYARSLKASKGLVRPGITAGTAAAFHQAEFTSLKNEIAELLKNIASNFQYAAIGSSGVIAWVITTQASPHKLGGITLAIALWLPFTLACFLVSLSVTQYIRISEIGCYLWRLEGALSAPDLGWEVFFAKRERSVGLMYGIGWVLLLFGDFLMGLFGSALV